LVWAVVFGLSILIRRPVVGYIWGWVNSHDRDWRGVRRAVLAFDLATFVWVLVFTSRFVVQQHLYDSDQTGWLGVARIAMGWPLTAVAALVTYLAIRAAQKAVHAHDADESQKAEETPRAAEEHGDVAQPDAH
jgi:TRAP-type C4-dicarboxylate transport system permease small subunit